MSREIWKSIAGHLGYEVSNRGRVRSVSRTIRGRFWHGQIIQPWVKACGHLLVHLELKASGKRGRAMVHRLVLEAFAGPSPSRHVCRHLNGNPTDNRWPENLEWNTRRRNLQDIKWHGGHRQQRLTVEDVKAIKHVLGGPLRWGDKARLAERHGVARTTITELSSGRTHADV